MWLSASMAAVGGHVAAIPTLTALRAAALWGEGRDAAALLSSNRAVAASPRSAASCSAETPPAMYCGRPRGSGTRPPPRGGTGGATCASLGSGPRDPTDPLDARGPRRRLRPRNDHMDTWTARGPHTDPALAPLCKRRPLQRRVLHIRKPTRRAARHGVRDYGSRLTCWVNADVNEYVRDAICIVRASVIWQCPYHPKCLPPYTILRAMNPVIPVGLILSYRPTAARRRTSHHTIRNIMQRAVRSSAHPHASASAYPPARHHFALLGRRAGRGWRAAGEPLRRRLSAMQAALQRPGSVEPFPSPASGHKRSTTTPELPNTRPSERRTLLARRFRPSSIVLEQVFTRRPILEARRPVGPARDLAHRLSKSAPEARTIVEYRPHPERPPSGEVPVDRISGRQ